MHLMVFKPPLQVPLFASWDGHSKNRDTLPADWKELVASRAPAGAAYSFACMPIFQGRRLVGALALACLGSNPLAAQQDLARLDSGEDCDARATDPGVLKGPMWMQQVGRPALQNHKKTPLARQWHAESSCLPFQI